MTINRPDHVTVNVEMDDVKAGCWLVAIREGSGALIGIPLREVSKGTAEMHRQSLGFAFEYGARHATSAVTRQANKLWWSVQHTVDEKDQGKIA
jgi:hypothetical protein